jgi:molecular chaperone DnaK (HSP70)
LGVYYDVRKAIITVPANFFDQQIRSVLEACKAAGLDIEEEKVRQAAERMRGTQQGDVTVGVILDEPSAAVLYYIYHLSGDTSQSNVLDAASQEGGVHLLVFDYGGGTLDVSIANVTRRESGEVGIKILANMGDNRIGGDSIDLILMQEMLKRCKQDLKGFDFDTTLISANFKELEERREKESWSREVWSSVLNARAAWKDLAERVKIRFSNEGAPDEEVLPQLIVVVANGKLLRSPKGSKITVPRDHFESSLLQDTMKKCRQLVSSALSLAELEPNQIDYIFHTGRQSLLRRVRDEVRSLFPKLTDDRDILDREQLKVCVAKGAVLYGWMRDRLIDAAAKVHFLNEGRRLPHSYGVEKFVTPLRSQFDEIIPRGAVHPVEKEKKYPPEMIQSSGYLNLKFFQNTGVRKDIVKNPEVSLIGQILFNTMADGEPGCTVRFVIDANRKLEVFADQQRVPIKPARLQGEESWMS